MGLRSDCSRLGAAVWCHQRGRWLLSDCGVGERRQRADAPRPLRASPLGVRQEEHGRRLADPRVLEPLVSTSHAGHAASASPRDSSSVACAAATHTIGTAYPYRWLNSSASSQIAEPGPHPQPWEIAALAEAPCLSPKTVEANLAPRVSQAWCPVARRAGRGDGPARGEHRFIGKPPITRRVAARRLAR
jgi:hypothetical protein